MEIILIAAVSKDRVIGKQGGIPWKIKEDLSFFKEKTLNSPIIMGRATYNSIGRPLPNRLNIVMTRSMKNTEGVTEVTSVKEAVKTASKNKDSSKVYVIGGENIYKEFLPIAHRMVLTEVELNIEDGDTFFPEWSISEWQEQSRDQREENGIKFSFVEYTRN
ncbi:dihydrofolate reductase [Gammaproteobacteria bacterium]|nr:dihydrofolate reductase [Gammaproteobacteria bacterium]|tara:strand:+ start:9674 stop:10159 length:486 start_codon:yes stop_codon:yes gene_type:complete